MPGNIGPEGFPGEIGAKGEPGLTGKYIFLFITFYVFEI
jgi:hypothetical protein